MSERFGVAGQVAVVTGASSGIGRAIAERFAAAGTQVAICSREQGNVDPVAEEIDEAGGEALAVECDVTDRGAVEALVEATVEEYGRVDCLVDNAGASFMAGFDDISENGWETIADIAQFLASPASSYVVGETITAGGVPRVEETPEA